MNARESALIDMITELKGELDDANERIESSEDFYRWWKEADKEKDEYERKNEVLIEENSELRKRIEVLETQLEELSQAKAASVMLTDTAAKGVL